MTYTLTQVLICYYEPIWYETGCLWKIRENHNKLLGIGLRDTREGASVPHLLWVDRDLDEQFTNFFLQISNILCVGPM